MSLDRGTGSFGPVQIETRPQKGEHAGHRTRPRFSILRALLFLLFNSESESLKKMAVRGRKIFEQEVEEETEEDIWFWHSGETINIIGIVAAKRARRKYSERTDFWGFLSLVAAKSDSESGYRFPYFRAFGISRKAD